MTIRVRLLSGSVHYPPELVLHTARSGRIVALDELYLVVERDGAVAGFGEIRENIAYLTGRTPAAVRAAVIRLVQGIDWTDRPDAIHEQMKASQPEDPAIALALIDTMLLDWTAREREGTVAELFGVPHRDRHPTNQSLFLSDDAGFAEMAARYVARGFRKLKVRVGGFEDKADLARIALLRDRFGAEIEIAIDANGAWTPDQALRILDALTRFDIAYAEEPVTAGDWEAAIQVAKRSAIPIMLDESVGSRGDIERVIDAGGLLGAHLKIVKLGGLAPTVDAGRRLAASGIPFMIGQMNEGAGATAAAYHCAVATGPTHAELYGADGLLDDPVSGLRYADGEVRLDRAPGLGVSIDTSALKLIWELRA